MGSLGFVFPHRGGRSLAALAAKTVGFAFVHRMTVVGPLLPADVELLSQESLLCQLQSRFGGGLSIVRPAVGHHLLVLRQKRGQLVQLAHGGANAPGICPSAKGSLPRVSSRIKLNVP